MAIHLNLYHEIQTQQQQSKRDPFKLGMLALLLIAICFASYYVFRLDKVSRVNGQLAGLQTQWDVIKPKQEAADKRALELNALITAKTTLINRIENRFYWAPVLEQLLQIVPPEIQIKRFVGGTALDKIKPTVFSLEGIAAGTNPRSITEELRTALNKSKKYKAEFKTLEEATEPLRIADKRLPLALFTIDVEVINSEKQKLPVPTR